jgi:predicted transcriptional regulator of viral defense system
MLERLPPSFTTSQAEAAGVARWRLYQLRDQGHVVALSRGAWRRADAPPTAHEGLLAVTLRSPHGTVCLLSALDFHELTDDIPNVVHLAVPRDRPRPSIDYPPVQVHTFDADTFHLGREHVEVAPGETMAVYDPVRTVADAVRLRGQVGTDIAYGAARVLLNRRRSAARDLAAMCEALRCAGPVHELLKVLQA